MGCFRVDGGQVGAVQAVCPVRSVVATTSDAHVKRPCLCTPHGFAPMRALAPSLLFLPQALAAATTKPLVVVLLHGGPLDVADMMASPRVGAILSAWVPGQHGALGIADLLLGRTAPSGARGEGRGGSWASLKGLLAPCLAQGMPAGHASRLGAARRRSSSAALCPAHYISIRRLLLAKFPLRVANGGEPGPSRVHSLQDALR